MMRNFLVVCICLLMPGLWAQDYKLDNNLVIRDENGQKFDFGWSGGMNSPHFSNVDLNLDGVDDIVFYDRGGKVWIPFIQEGGTGQIAYRYAPEYMSHFANCECTRWGLMKDYNCDGKADVICGAASGQNVKIYEQTIFNGDSVGFVLKYDPVRVLSGTNNRAIYTLNTDIPAFVDVDYDGDLDIISSQNLGTFYFLNLNLAMERYGRCDTLDFEKGTSCWGHFYEANTSDTLYVSYVDSLACSRGAEDPRGATSRHAGSSLLLLDMDADSLMDGLIGDVSYPTMNAVFNGGEIFHAFMDSVDYHFPTQDQAVQMNIFPAAFHVDVNNDGSRDLLISSNDLSIGEDVDGVLYYQNFGPDNLVDFRFQGRGLFAGQSYDAGRLSNPTFIDYNDDGLQDILVGTLNAHPRVGDSTKTIYQLQLFKNVGSQDVPEYQLVDKDYLNGSQEFLRFQAAAPVAGDLDNDGDDDLLIGNWDGKIFYYQNTAMPGQEAVWTLAADGLTEAGGLEIDEGGFSAPELFDIDGDEDLDLFIGDDFGRIAFYENIGNKFNFNFSKVADEWGGINFKDPITDYEFLGRTHPRFLDYDGDGTVELLLGTEYGLIEVYEDLSNPLTDTLVKSSDFMGMDFGGFPAPAAAVIDSTGDYSVIVGLARGGLMLVNTLEIVEDTTTAIQPELSQGRDFSIFPNPTEGRFQVDFAGDQSLGREGTIEVFNAMGQLLYQQAHQGRNTQIDLTAFPAGLYHVRVRMGAQWGITKLIVQPR
ncbi:MAG: T9SS type A sorting domain-containing protein [Bacteroidota bacterium]